MHRHPPSSFSLLLLLATFLLTAAAADDDITTITTRSLVGINYGVGLAKAPLPKTEAFDLLNSKGIYKVKMFDHDLETIEAIQATIPGAQVTLGFSNNELTALASNDSLALSLLTPFKPFNTILDLVALGSEPNESTEPPRLAKILTPALINVIKALQSLGMKAKVTVPFTMELLEVSSPPSAGAFKTLWNSTLSPLLHHLNGINAPFMMNIHPYGAWAHQPRKHNTVPLPYALGDSPVVVLMDGTQHAYTSLLEALHDSVLAALARAGYPNMNVIVGETGWPSAGGKGATVANACAYNNYVIRRANTRVGTPARPQQPLELFLFSAFDELLKPAGTIEPNWGVLREDGTDKYGVDWLGKGNVSCPLAASAGSRRLRR